MLEGSWCILLEIITPCGLARPLPFSPPRLLLCVFPILSTFTTTYHLTTDDSPSFSQIQSTAWSPLAACSCGSLLSISLPWFSLVLSQCPLLFSVSHRDNCVCAVCKSNLFRVIWIASCGQSIGGRNSRESCLHSCLFPKALVALIWLLGWPAWTTWHSLTH